MTQSIPTGPQRIQSLNGSSVSDPTDYSSLNTKFSGAFFVCDSSGFASALAMKLQELQTLVGGYYGISILSNTVTINHPVKVGGGLGVFGTAPPGTQPVVTAPTNSLTPLYNWALGIQAALKAVGIISDGS
jgi:hypothetical protein